jgi:hypothetical protein
MRRRPSRPDPALVLDALLEQRRTERQRVRAAERRELGRKAALGIASPAELDQLFGASRYGRI